MLLEVLHWFDAKPESYVISAPLAGLLVKEGLPLANARIIRRVSWNGNEYGRVDEFYTNDRGYFEIPAHHEELSLGILDEFFATTELFSDREINENAFWYSQKKTREVYNEKSLQFNELVCDINMVEERVNLGNIGVLTKCQWQGMPELG